MENLTAKLQYVGNLRDHAIKILEVANVTLELAQYAGALEAKAKELDAKVKESEAKAETAAINEAEHG